MKLPDFISKRLPDLHLDYEGQRLAEVLFQYIIIFFSLAGFCWGYYIQQISQMIYVLAAGVFLSCVLVLPPWPFYRKHSIKWASPIQDGDRRSSSKKGR